MPLDFQKLFGRNVLLLQVIRIKNAQENRVDPLFVLQNAVQQRIGQLHLFQDILYHRGDI